MKEVKKAKTSFRWNGAATSADIDNVTRCVFVRTHMNSIF